MNNNTYGTFCLSRQCILSFLWVYMGIYGFHMIYLALQLCGLIHVFQVLCGNLGFIQVYMCFICLRGFIRFYTCFSGFMWECRFHTGVGDSGFGPKCSGRQESSTKILCSSKCKNTNKATKREKQGSNPGHPQDGPARRWTYVETGEWYRWQWSGHMGPGDLNRTQYSKKRIFKVKQEVKKQITRNKRNHQKSQGQQNQSPDPNSRF